MTEPYQPGPRTWRAKFRDAFRGVFVGVRSQRSFAVHLPAAAAAAGLAAWLRVDLAGWCLLSLSIGAVVAAELFNAAVEQLARVVDPTENPHIRDSLDLAAGAVLAASGAAAVVGVLVLLPPLWSLLAAR